MFNISWKIIIILLFCTTIYSEENIEYTTGHDALYEVNYERAKKKLRPYKADWMLTKAAKACCIYRKNNSIDGHCGDHRFLPSTVNYPRSSVVGGCAAWYPEYAGNKLVYKFGSCAVYDNYTYAGAWAVIDKRTGKRYMQLFVR